LQQNLPEADLRQRHALRQLWAKKAGICSVIPALCEKKIGRRQSVNVGISQIYDIETIGHYHDITAELETVMLDEIENC
jgi:hypothetical protein